MHSNMVPSIRVRKSKPCDNILRARGRPTGRHISPPPRCLPRAPFLRRCGGGHESTQRAPADSTNRDIRRARHRAGEAAWDRHTPGTAHGCAVADVVGWNWQDASSDRTTGAAHAANVVGRYRYVPCRAERAGISVGAWPATRQQIAKAANARACGLSSCHSAETVA